ncbi:MAG: cobalamin-independent methionine synthase II family protein [Candidatus Tectomicrobia bacterium]|nr:cobalamin-independent methionine synthase II family protein [Candidatus Tectomicrobia bacterium]
MYTATKDLKLPTTITGSVPRPAWYTENLRGRPFRVAMAEKNFREQYLDAVSCIIRDQERAGLDIVTDGDARFDTDVGGRSWVNYTLERLQGVTGYETGRSEAARKNTTRPGDILFEVLEAWALPQVTGKLGPGPLELPQLWRSAQQMTAKPVKVGVASPETVALLLPNRHYKDREQMFADLSAIMREEFLRVAGSGAAVFQVEEPWVHRVDYTQKDAPAQAELSVRWFNQSVRGLREKLELWCHTCWGNPAQQRTFDINKRYEPALEYMNELDADVLTFECATTKGTDIESIGRKITKPKVAIGVIDHHTLQVERPEEVAALLRTALRHIPPERLCVSTDCGFGREGMSRRHAFYKMVALTRGTNIVRRELGLPEAHIPAAESRFALADEE